ncbi:uncharacterized protein Z519_08897 [Cladophialophora bantiana CBS 173.52]|uniref:Uncharacterized protein n=1 Tax=Cladophialophora bantiana (strain ATCC 10958 / CBS 173.52 / CDC B-1940 / NIH 8579) TaxID=1442370 RepID=A0A0D2HAE9_CLAB1|nr:uncharacterized protein Z519_08897 [Cladophialophora bantiana CBS 173.52]KIW90253.1 hypothetical protein Z519_08897 [Cladophialophora bantiana CBS 173.52]
MPSLWLEELEQLRHDQSNNIPHSNEAQRPSTGVCGPYSWDSSMRQEQIRAMMALQYSDDINRSRWNESQQNNDLSYSPAFSGSPVVSSTAPQTRSSDIDSLFEGSDAGGEISMLQSRFEETAGESPADAISHHGHDRPSACGPSRQLQGQQSASLSEAEYEPEEPAHGEGGYERHPATQEEVPRRQLPENGWHSNDNEAAWQSISQQREQLQGQREETDTKREDVHDCSLTRPAAAETPRSNVHAFQACVNVLLAASMGIGLWNPSDTADVVQPVRRVAVNLINIRAPVVMSIRAVKTTEISPSSKYIRNKPQTINHSLNHCRRSNSTSGASARQQLQMPRMPAGAYMVVFAPVRLGDANVIRCIRCAMEQNRTMNSIRLLNPAFAETLETEYRPPPPKLTELIENPTHGLSPQINTPTFSRKDSVLGMPRAATPAFGRQCSITPSRPDTPRPPAGSTPSTPYAADVLQDYVQQSIELGLLPPNQEYIRPSVEPELPPRNRARESTPAHVVRSSTPSPFSRRGTDVDVRMRDASGTILPGDLGRELSLPPPTSQPVSVVSYRPAVSRVKPALPPIPDSGSPINQPKRGERRKSAVQGSKVEKRSVTGSTSKPKSRNVTRKSTASVGKLVDKAKKKTKDAAENAGGQGQPTATSKDGGKVAAAVAKIEQQVKQQDEEKHPKQKDGTATLELELFNDPVPAEARYAIFSHTWEDDEVTFEDMKGLAVARGKRGFAKIQAVCALAVGHGLQMLGSTPVVSTNLRALS